METLEKSLKLVNKRLSKDYLQISAYLPKALAIEFKVKCARLTIERSEALEQAITLWLNQKEN